MSVTPVESLEIVSELIHQFNEYENLFTPVFLQYNGNSRIISLQYRLRTFKNFMEDEKYLENLLDQYVKNPILIPGKLYSIQINDNKSPNNLALDSRYIMKIDEFNAFNLSNLLNLESEYINIFIDSNFTLNFDSLISTHISKQPKVIDKYITQYELTSLLKNNQLPEKFRCLNIPVGFEMVLNDFIEHFLQKKFLIAYSEWHKIEKKKFGPDRKKNHYAQMISNKYRITPLEFGSRIRTIIDMILAYIQKNHNSIIKIENIKGYITLSKLEGVYTSQKNGMVNKISMKFETSLDNDNFATKSNITFNFKWMKSIFRKILPEVRT
ncbi:hypothetical protein LCGC14_1463860, partial [marine sediment metagenome]